MHEIHEFKSNCSHASVLEQKLRAKSSLALLVLCSWWVFDQPAKGSSAGCSDLATSYVEETMSRLLRTYSVGELTGEVAKATLKHGNFTAELVIVETSAMQKNVFADKRYQESKQLLESVYSFSSASSAQLATDIRQNLNLYLNNLRIHLDKQALRNPAQPPVQQQSFGLGHSHFTWKIASIDPAINHPTLSEFQVKSHFFHETLNRYLKSQNKAQVTPKNTWVGYTSARFYDQKASGKYDVRVDFIPDKSPDLPLGEAAFRAVLHSEAWKIFEQRMGRGATIRALRQRTGDYGTWYSGESTEVIQRHYDQAVKEAMPIVEARLRQNPDEAVFLDLLGNADLHRDVTATAMLIEQTVQKVLNSEQSGQGIFQRMLSSKSSAQIDVPIPAVLVQSVMRLYRLDRPQALVKLIELIKDRLPNFEVMDRLVIQQGEAMGVARGNLASLIDGMKEYDLPSKRVFTDALGGLFDVRSFGELTDRNFGRFGTDMLLTGIFASPEVGREAMRILEQEGFTSEVIIHRGSGYPWGIVATDSSGRSLVYFDFNVVGMDTRSMMANALRAYLELARHTHRDAEGAVQRQLDQSLAVLTQQIKDIEEGATMKRSIWERLQFMSTSLKE